MLGKGGDFMSEPKTELMEYTKENAELFPLDFRLGVDDQLIATTGADATIIWEMNDSKIYFSKTYSEDGKDVAIELAYALIMPGYNAKHHLYALDGRIYVEDDYVWLSLARAYPDSNPENYRTVYASEPESGVGNDEDDEGSEAASEPTKVSYAQSGGGPAWINFFEEDYAGKDGAPYEPLVVNNFNADNPILKVERAYFNALSEVEEYLEPGFIVLLHDGHYYVPVESFEDPINRENYYFTKLFNSFPVGVESGRAMGAVSLEIFGSHFSIGIRYRKGYSVNWNKFLLEYLLPADYLDQIQDLYKVTDRPFDEVKKKPGISDYDGFKLQYYDKNIEDDTDDDDDEDDEDQIRT